jgi:hypothetical protein
VHTKSLRRQQQQQAKRWGHITKKLQGLSPTEKVLSAIAANSGLTLQMLSWIFGVSIGYLCTGFGLTPAELSDVRSGRKTLSSFHARNGKTVEHGVARLAAKHGIDLVTTAAVAAWERDRAAVPAE